MVLKKNGVCYALGRKDYGRLGIGNIEEELVDTLTAVGGLSKVAQIACGECCSFAITDEGEDQFTTMGDTIIKTLFHITI